MTNKSEKTKPSKANNQYSTVKKEKRLLTRELKKAIGGRRITDNPTFGTLPNHNEVFVAV